ncbi:MAG: MFS transporter, partial [Acidimicrobiales bacterium]
APPPGSAHRLPGAPPPGSAHRLPGAPPPGGRPGARTPGGRSLLSGPLGGAARGARRRLELAAGGPARARVILVLAAVLALNSADTATVGAAATQLRSALHVSNFDIGLLVAVTSIVGAVFSIPFGVLADRVRRTSLLSFVVVLWGLAMLASASVSSFGSLLLVRVCLGAATAAAGPVVASLVGDYFPSRERGKIYGYILSGELLGAGFGFVITGDLAAAISWRAAFVVLALPAVLVAVAVRRLPEPVRGGASQMVAGAARISGYGSRKEARWAGLSAAAAAATSSGEASGSAEHAEPDATDAQRIAAERGITPDERLVLRRDPRRMKLPAAVRYVLKLRTNVILIASGAFGYFFLAGVETFGLEFAKAQYGVGQFVATLVMVVLGGGALLGVLAGGRIGDALLHRGYLNGRILVPAIAALATVALFIPALISHSAATALPYLLLAAFALSAQNPPIDAARLDIVPPLLWGRAEGVRTCLRTGAQALAPLLFGAVADGIGGHVGLQYAFLIMLLPLLAGSVILFRGLRTYPTDVATAAASAAAIHDRPRVR